MQVLRQDLASDTLCCNTLEARKVHAMRTVPRGVLGVVFLALVIENYVRCALHVYAAALQKHVLLPQPLHLSQ
eukprot:877213-Amphidinium_carterae.1